MSAAWAPFPALAGTALAAWFAAIVIEVLPGGTARRRIAAAAFYAAGEAAVVASLAWLWLSLERPPLRTLGETRLWYAALLPLCGFAVEWRWGTRWLSAISSAAASVFLVVNLLHPEIHDKVLMPALMSPWFIPHVIVYLVGYALMGAAALASVRGLFAGWRGTPVAGGEAAVSRLAVLGFVFLTLGMLSGAVWAKEAWGNYWTWDPKETWALLTWLTYLVFIHLAWDGKLKRTGIFVYLAAAFLVLLFCWFGFSLLSSAMGSIHSYSG